MYVVKGARGPFGVNVALLPSAATEIVPLVKVDPSESVKLEAPIVRVFMSLLN